MQKDGATKRFASLRNGTQPSAKQKNSIGTEKTADNTDKLHSGYKLKLTVYSIGVNI